MAVVGVEDGWARMQVVSLRVSSQTKAISTPTPMAGRGRPGFCKAGRSSDTLIASLRTERW